MTTRPHLLVVDDEPGIRESLSSILQDEGYEVESVASAEEALQRAINLLTTLQEGWSGVCTELAKANQPVTAAAPRIEPEKEQEQPVGSGDRSGDYYQEAIPVTSRGWSA